MEPQGLAQQGAQQVQGQQEPGMLQGMDQQQMMPLVQQVAKLLAQGVSPQELLQQGVPEEIIDAAMKMVGQQDHDTDQDPGQALQSMQGLAGRG